jgi:glyoxylase I family protein
MTTNSFAHVGMTVSSIDRSLAFYIDLLGLKLVDRRPGTQGDEVCFIDAGGCMLELIGPATGALFAEDVAVGRAGLLHLTFKVEDVDATVEIVRRAGGEVVEGPRDAYNRRMARRVAFCRDPDGILVEFLGE